MSGISIATLNQDVYLIINIQWFSYILKYSKKICIFLYIYENTLHKVDNMFKTDKTDLLKLKNIQVIILKRI